MTKEEREAFLAEPYVGVLSVAAESGRAPLATPVWYDYQPGGQLMVITTPSLRKVRLIEAAGRFALCAQETTSGYKYATVEGPLVEIRPSTEQERHDLAARYLGPAAATAFIEANRAEQSNDVAILMQPERWHTADFSDMA